MVEYGHAGGGNGAMNQHPHNLLDNRLNEPFLGRGNNDVGQAPVFAMQQQLAMTHAAPASTADNESQDP